MNIYFAPMEGITAYPYRMTHMSLYGGVDRYFLPFVQAHQTLTLKNKEKKDLAPEHNPGGRSVPQLMSNKAPLALAYIRMIADMGYREINFNLGCPSGTVTAKKNGAGFLTDPDAMDAFFYQLFDGLQEEGFLVDRGIAAGDILRAENPEKAGFRTEAPQADGLQPERPRKDEQQTENLHPEKMTDPTRPSVPRHLRISVKTRIGMMSTDRIDDVVRVYGRYPFSEIIVHPRLGKDAYRGPVNMQAFDRFYEGLDCPVSYNGDIITASDAWEIIRRYPRLHAIMIGRGLLRDPALAEKIREGAAWHKAEQAGTGIWEGAAWEKAGQAGTGIREGAAWHGAGPEDPRLSLLLSRLEAAWLDALEGDRTSTLYRLKEFWSYLALNYEDVQGIRKKISKCRNLSDYHDIRASLGL